MAQAPSNKTTLLNALAKIIFFMFHLISLIVKRSHYLNTSFLIDFEDVVLVLMFCLKNMSKHELVVFYVLDTMVDYL
ncbi:hypothetical protein D9M71_792160 [compost metagenome]